MTDLDIVDALAVLAAAVVADNPRSVRADRAGRTIADLVAQAHTDAGVAPAGDVDAALAWLQSDRDPDTGTMDRSLLP